MFFLLGFQQKNRAMVYFYVVRKVILGDKKYLYDLMISYMVQIFFHKKALVLPKGIQ
jgi:hypothetical protein